MLTSTRVSMFSRLKELARVRVDGDDLGAAHPPHKSKNKSDHDEVQECEGRPLSVFARIEELAWLAMSTSDAADDQPGEGKVDEDGLTSDTLGEKGVEEEQALRVLEWGLVMVAYRCVCVCVVVVVAYRVTCVLRGLMCCIFR